MQFNNNLRHQLDFISELEKLKLVLRQNSVLGMKRQENPAEHSWHVALMAIVLQEHSASSNLDMQRVVTMLLVHDLVEIEAGDHFLFDSKKEKIVSEEESKAAKKLFELLPENQAKEFLEFWIEFEEVKTEEAKYARAMDALQPLLNHLLTAEPNHNPYKLTKAMILEKKRIIEQVSPGLWSLAQEIIDDSVKKGLYIE